ncbi:MAG: phage tail protein [Methanobacteriaceae archaeon]|nr:phage tail protein [Methanobacteriaceae archaeon]
MSSFTILILSPDEYPITYLNSELTEIEETREDKKMRKIKITHPITDNNQEYREWFRIGNKIWIPNSEVTEECLYVINTEYELDYWEENIIELSAEEILVELNNVPPVVFVEPQPIQVVPEDLNSIDQQDNVRKTRLTEWFGKYYNIGKVDYPTSLDLNKIHPCGSMTLIELMNYLEEETGNKFITWYKKGVRADGSNYIVRHLDFLTPNHIGVTHKSILDVGYNTDNMEYIVDESDTIKGVSPIFSVSGRDSAVKGTVTHESVTKNEELRQVISNWLNFAVEKGQEIDRLPEKYTEGEGEEKTEQIRYLGKWRAPFYKNSGQLFIYDDVSTETEYNKILPKADLDKNYNGDLQPDVIMNSSQYDIYPKLGSLKMSETDNYAIYEKLAEELIANRYPIVEMDIEAHDLNAILGNDEYTYHLYDRIYMKVPGYHKLLQGKIVKTVKNPHDPGKNKITINNLDVGKKILQSDTWFECADASVYEGEGRHFVAHLKRLRIDKNGIYHQEPVSDALVSITVIKDDETVTDTTVTVTNEVTTTETTGSSNTITVTMKPSCSYNCGSYTNHTTTFENKCCFCGATLRINPKGVPEGELTCSKCGADFCGVCGRDKMRPSRCSLTKTSASQTTTKTEKQTVTLESADSIMADAGRRIRYVTPSCSQSCQDVDGAYECVNRRGVADCFGMSGYLYKRLNAAGHKTRIIAYRTFVPQHRTVQIFRNGEWQDANYAGFDRNFRTTRNKPGMFVCKDAPEGQLVEGDLKEQNVQTKIPGYKKTYTRITDADGAFNLQINLRSAEYKLQLDYGGDIEHGSASSIINLNVD